MSKKTRRKYTDEFKDESVKLVTEQGYKISEAARNLGTQHRCPQQMDKGSFFRDKSLV